MVLIAGQAHRDVEPVQGSSSRATGPSYETLGRRVRSATATAGSPISRAITSPPARSRPSRVARTAVPGVGVSYSRLNVSSNPATVAASGAVATLGVSTEGCSIPASVP